MNVRVSDSGQDIPRLLFRGVALLLEEQRGKGLEQGTDRLLPAEEKRERFRRCGG